MIAVMGGLLLSVPTAWAAPTDNSNHLGSVSLQNKTSHAPLKAPLQERKAWKANAGSGDNGDDALGRKTWRAESLEPETEDTAEPSPQNATPFTRKGTWRASDLEDNADSQMQQNDEEATEVGRTALPKKAEEKDVSSVIDGLFVEEEKGHSPRKGRTYK